MQGGDDMAMDFRRESEVLKALGHPVRLRIVAGLMEQRDGCNVNKMVTRLGLPQSSVSQSLAILRHAGVLEYRREGVKNCYRVADRRVGKLLKTLQG